MSYFDFKPSIRDFLQSYTSSFVYKYIGLYLFIICYFILSLCLGQCFGQQLPQQLPVSPLIPSQSLSSQQSSTILNRDQAIELALKQVSTFQQAKLNERLAEEEIKQSRLAFLPQVTSPSTFIYTSPSRSKTLGQPSTPSFIANNAITEYLGVISVAGEIDIAGKLRATLRRNVALLEAAQAGTEISRRALIDAVDENYYGYGLAIAKRQSADLNLEAAQKFEQITKGLLDAGEVAQIDLTRAHLQTLTRQDEDEQAITNELVAKEGLCSLIGYDPSISIVVSDLTLVNPNPIQVSLFSTSTIVQRPEFFQFDAQERAAEQDLKIARAGRWPQISYTLLGGFDTDSLRLNPLSDHSGIAATINITIPIFDWGLNRSRERQAQLKVQSIGIERTLALRNFNQQFNTARIQTLSAATRIRILRTALVDAQTNVEVSIARYQAGEAQIVEVTDAQTTLAAQRTALFQALFDYQIANTRLARASGQ